MAKLSRREVWAAKTGRSKYEYASSPEGIAAEKIKDYYKDRGSLVDKQYDIQEDKIIKDFELIMKEAGFAESDLLEDYKRNIKRLDEDKETDLENLNYYIETQTGRTQEDLDTALSNRLRQFNLTMDREAESLAARNVVFSGMRGVRGKEEGDINADYTADVEEFERTAQRSFQDLERLELVKSAAIERQYSRDVEDLETAKKRGLRDIDLGVEKAEANKKSSLDSLDINKDITEFDADYARGNALSSLATTFDTQRLTEKYAKPLWELLMS